MNELAILCSEEYILQSYYFYSSQFLLFHVLFFTLFLRVLSVAPNQNRKTNVESIVADPQADMFYLNQHSTADFVNRLQEILQCT